MNSIKEANWFDKIVAMSIFTFFIFPVLLLILFFAFLINLIFILFLKNKYSFCPYCGQVIKKEKNKLLVCSQCEWEEKNSFSFVDVMKE